MYHTKCVILYLYQMIQDFNPFLTTGYKGDNYFCDRQAETTQLLTNIKNGNNTTLFALRRLGKTGLIQHVFHLLATNKKKACIYLDIFATQDLKDFTNQLATAIYQKFPEKKGIGAKLWNIITMLRPTISYDGLSGSPEISLELGPQKQYEKTIAQLLQFLDAQTIKTIIAIDEFQQILTYPEKNVDALLRTYIQPLQNVQFIFCGSNQSMMNEIFNNAKRPFYASCNNLNLDFIPTDLYAAFITQKFAERKRKISAEAIGFVLEFTQRHTYYTQMLCNQLFATNHKNIQLAQVHETCKDLLLLNESIFFQYRNLLTAAQWHLLTAIAKENMVTKPHAQAFIKKYQLGTSSLVTRGIDALLQKEMIYYNAAVEEPYYVVYDKFLMRWLQ